MKMSFSFKLISHPTGGKNNGPKLLRDHLANVGSNTKKILKDVQITDFYIKNKRISKEDLLKLAYIAGISHDFGKATTYFQKHIKNQEGHEKTELSFHSQISSLFSYYLADALLKDEELAYVAYLIVYYHHGDLRDPDRNLETLLEKENNVIKQIEDIRKNSYPEIREIYRSLLLENPTDITDFLSQDRIEETIKKIKKIERAHLFSNETSYNYYFLVLFIYSVLLHADKIDAASLNYDRIIKEREKWSNLPPRIIDEVLDSMREKKRFSSAGNAINDLRDQAYKDAIASINKKNLREQRLFTIELPTGLGKTLISYSLAFRMREIIQKKLGFTPRVIYSLPFLSIIDQNFAVIKEVLSKYIGTQEVPTSLLLQHHHLSDIQFTFSKDGDSDVESYSVQDMRNRFLLMEGWNSEIIVTSFVQLFHTIISNRNASVMKFHNIANSIIVLDEVQSIPYRYLLLISRVLKYISYLFNCWVILMTATMPIMFEKSETTPVIEASDKYFDQVNRISYSYYRKTLKIIDMRDLILKSDEKDIMVVMNTIGSSRDLYRLLKEKYTQMKGEPDIRNGYADFGELYIINLSTAIIPLQRKERIEILKKRGDGKRRIAITTQIIEAGVDIDFDVVFRDQAPLDSIIQAGGRANRNGERGNGEVQIVSIQDDKGKSYANRVYDQTLLDASREVLDQLFKNQEIVEERGMHGSILDYYHFLRERKSETKSREYIGNIENIQFSSIGKFKLIEDDFPKVDVFIPYDETATRTWNEYSIIKNEENPNTRWEKMLNIRNRLYAYVVSVDKKITGGISEPIVNSKYIGIEYDKEVGVVGIDTVW